MSKSNYKLTALSVTTNKSMFRFVYVSLQVTLFAVAAERRPCSNRSISPACRAHSSKPTAGATAAVDRWDIEMDGQTDGRTPYRYIDPVAY